MILIQRFGNRMKIAKLTYTTSMGVSPHNIMIPANLKSRQQHFLSKPPNMMFANISAYMVIHHCVQLSMTHVDGDTGCL